MQTTATGAWAGASFHAPFGDPWYRVGALATDRRYTGQRSLEGSLGSLYHYQARWYSPVLGRFLSPDPIVPGTGQSAEPETLCLFAEQPSPLHQVQRLRLHRKAAIVITWLPINCGTAGSDGTERLYDTIE